tara:strand:- start:394 stop:951 length:558 start_codon:yes stop_codon:yes gene_type:complete
VNVNDLVKYGEKYFKENDDRPFNGIVFDLSKNTGNKILEYKMVNGLKNGIFQKWSSDGNLIRKGKFFNNDTTGNWTYWYGNEQKHKEGTYKDNNKDGLWTSWYENGFKKSETGYDNGKLKVETLHHDNGKKKSKRIIGSESYTYWDKFDGKEYNGKNGRGKDEKDGEFLIVSYSQRPPIDPYVLH